MVGGLSGFTIAITADRRREEQAELIQRRGGEVLFGPVIHTHPLTNEDGLRLATEELIAAPPDIVVLSTALGVRGWLSAAESVGLGDALLDALADRDVFARGPKAAGAALTAGLDVTWKTPSATHREMVDHLASLPSARPDGSATRVAVQLDGADGTPLADEIAALGYDVVAVPVYRWALPEDLTLAERLLNAVADHAVDAVTFTSAHAVSNFMVLAERWDLLTRVLDACNTGAVTPVCVGPVSSARARSVGFEAPTEPVHARLGAMIQSLVASFADRAVTFDLDGIDVVLQGRLVAVGTDAAVTLTDRERAVLEVLARRPGAVVSKQTLLRRVWCDQPDGGDEHVVEVTVGRLRRRLGPAGNGIETVMRRGYRLAAS